MTLTYRNTRREYQRHPRGAPDGAISNVKARITSSNGESRVGSETDRIRLYNATDNPFNDTSLVGRLVTLRNTPPSAGTQGTKKMENWTVRIVAVDTVSGAWVQLEGLRWDDAVTGIQYTIHASATFTAASAAFPIDEGPTGPNAGPYPAQRTNSGPTVYQSIYLPNPVNKQLSLLPWLIGANSGAVSGNATTAVIINDPFDLISTFPTETSLEWSLRDAPAYSVEQLYKIIHRFNIQAGWAVYQSRGRNNGVGAAATGSGSQHCVVHDTIYQSLGEDGKKSMFLRYAAFNMGDGTGGGIGASSKMGIDWAFWSAWSRSFANASGNNTGQGVNPLRAHFNTTAGGWACVADGANNTTSGGPYLNPSSVNGSAIGANVNWGSPNHATAGNQTLRPNQKNTPEGGDLQIIHYVLFGDMDELHVYVESPGYGANYIGMGALEARTGGNPNNFVSNAPAVAGSNVNLRLGGPGTSNGTDPTATTPPYKVGDAFQIVGQTVNPTITAGTADNGEHIESSTISSFPGLLPSFGSITEITGATHADGELLTINDGQGHIVTFEYDSNSSVLPGNVRVDITGSPTAATMASRLDTAIGTTALNLTHSPSTNVVNLTHNTAGGVGNVLMTTTVANGGYAIAGLYGGGYSVQFATLANNYATGYLAGEDPQPCFFLRFPHVASATLQTTQGTYRLSNRARNNDATYKDHNGPVLTSGCGFDAIARLQAVPDTSSVMPNAISGRMGFAKLQAIDSAGQQVRGQSKYCRIGPARTGAWQTVRDRNGNWHVLIPVPDLTVPPKTEIPATALGTIVVALGSMPTAMARVA
jgi:hypothetical protein